MPAVFLVNENQFIRICSYLSIRFFNANYDANVFVLIYASADPADKVFSESEVLRKVYLS